VAQEVLTLQEVQVEIIVCLAQLPLLVAAEVVVELATEQTLVSLAGLEEAMVAMPIHLLVQVQQIKDLLVV
jgi:hypothetical protein